MKKGKLLFTVILTTILFGSCGSGPAVSESGSGRNATLYYERAHGYWDKGNFDRALADFNEAIGLDPDYVDAYKDRSVLYLAEYEDYDRSISDSTKVLSLQPYAFDAYTNRGSAYLSKRNLDSAIADTSKAIELILGIIETGDKSDTEIALTWFERALLVRAASYGLKEDWANAIVDYQALLTLYPNDKEIQQWLRGAQAKLGN